MLPDVVTFIFCLNYLLGVIYTSFMKEMGFKVPCWGFMVLSGTFKAPGHLIPGLRNPFPGKKDKVLKKLKIEETLEQDAAGLCETC